MPHPLPEREAAPAAPPLPRSGERGPGGEGRRTLIGFALLGGAALLSLAWLAGLWLLLVALSWPHRESPGNPIVGINFDCNYAEFLMLEEPGGPYVSDARPGRAEWCAQTFATILDGLGTKYVRLSVQWSEVEPADGKFDFRTLDALLAEAERRDVHVLLTVGMKGQRHPEYYIPDWVIAHSFPPRGAVVSDDPFIRDRAMAMVEAVVRHVAGSPAIDSWAAENEPFVASHRQYDWRLSAGWVAEVRETIRAHDPEARPVLVAHAQTFADDDRWQDALELGDALGASIYPYRDHRILGIDFVVPILELGPITPNYVQQRRQAAGEGKQFWLTEVQGEPWAHVDPRLITPERPSMNLSPRKFEESIEYARKTGAQRVYLWGAEWWLLQEQRYGDSSWSAVARDAIADGTSSAQVQ
jgi:hypothetical protein